MDKSYVILPICDMDHVIENSGMTRASVNKS